MTILNIHKKIVSDSLQQPVAVLIDYQDWLKIEQLLNLENTSTIQKKPLRSLQNFRLSLPIVNTSSSDLIRQLRDEGY
jgi:hypothetical protein